jgi:glycosyltransferase involved in cell wall biosynthesis
VVIAGAGSEKESLQKLAMQYTGVDIQFWNAPKAKVPEIQDRADVMVLPLKKGFSLSSIPSKLPSYMFSAKPVIACVDFNSDTALSIISCHCGWVEEPENIEHLKVCMQKAVATKKRILEKMGENGFNFAMTHFSRRSNLPKLCKVYEEILDP